MNKDDLIKRADEWLADFDKGIASVSDESVIIRDLRNALSQTPVRNSDGSFFQRKKSWKEDPNLYPAFWDRYLHDDCILIAISNQDNSPKVPTPDPQELVERVARAIHEVDYPGHTDRLWPQRMESMRELYRQFAKAAIAVMQGATR